MKPTEELFHVGQDRYEMKNLATDAAQSATLAKMRQFYDAELALIKARVVSNHGYEAYPTLFSRTLAWDAKAQVLKTLKPRAGGEGEGSGERKKKKAAK